MALAGGRPGGDEAEAKPFGRCGGLWQDADACHVPAPRNEPRARARLLLADCYSPNSSNSGAVARRAIK